MGDFDPASNLVAGVMVDENDSIDQPGSIITADTLNTLMLEQKNLITLGGGVPAHGTNNQQAASVAAYVAAAIASTTNSNNHFCDPCCRIGRGTAVALSTSKQYGKVDMVQAWASAGAVTAGTIDQDATGAAGGRTPYSVHLAGVTLTGGAALAFRRSLESIDAKDYIGGPAIIAVSVNQNIGAAIANATLTVNKANALDNFVGGVTLISASGNLPVPNGALTRLFFYVPNMGACGNGVEAILTLPTGAIVTKDIYVTDWQISPASVLAPFEIPKMSADQMAVERFAKYIGYGLVGFYINGSALAALFMTFGIPMRATPTVTALGTMSFIFNNNISTTSPSVGSTSGDQNGVKILPTTGAGAPSAGMPIACVSPGIILCDARI